MGPGYWTGWALGTALALLLVLSFDLNLFVCFILGFGLSFVGGQIGQSFDN